MRAGLAIRTRPPTPTTRAAFGFGLELIPFHAEPATRTDRDRPRDLNRPRACARHRKRVRFTALRARKRLHPDPYFDRVERGERAPCFTAQMFKRARNRDGFPRRRGNLFEAPLFELPRAGRRFFFDFFGARGVLVPPSFAFHRDALLARRLHTGDFHRPQPARQYVRDRDLTERLRVTHVLNRHDKLPTTTRGNTRRARTEIHMPPRLRAQRGRGTHERQQDRARSRDKQATDTSHLTSPSTCRPCASYGPSPA